MRFTILTILTFLTLHNYCQQDTISMLDEITNYLSEVKYNNIDTIELQVDDEYQIFLVYSLEGRILQIDGSGSGEFNSYNFSYYYIDDSLIYSNYYESRLMGHWSEFEDREYEYHDREEDVYYYKNEPIQASVIDSELENNEDSSENQTAANDISSVNAYYYIEHASKLVAEFKEVIAK